MRLRSLHYVGRNHLNVTNQELGSVSNVTLFAAARVRWRKDVSESCFDFPRVTVPTGNSDHPTAARDQPLFPQVTTQTARTAVSCGHGHRTDKSSPLLLWGNDRGTPMLPQWLVAVG